MKNINDLTSVELFEFLESKIENNTKLTPIELLEYLQLSYLFANGLDAPLEGNDLQFKEVMKGLLGKDDISDEFSAIMNHINNSYKDIVIQTRFQSSHFYYLLTDIVKDIEKIKDTVLDQQPFIKPETDVKMPCFGTIQSLVFSAEISMEFCTDKLIILSNGLFTYANLISKIMAQVFPVLNDGVFSTDKDKILENINNNPNVKLRFFDLMLACLFTGEPPMARQYYINLQINDLLTVFRESCEVFVVAHEYAHSLLGHLEDKNIEGKSSLDEFVNVDIAQVFHNWEDEFEADLLGAMLTLAVMTSKGYDLHMGMMGIVVCVHSFELFDLLHSLRTGNERGVSLTHPSGAMRQSFLIKRLFGESNAELFTTISSILDNLWSEFEMFYAKTAEVFKATYNHDIHDLPFHVIQDFIYRTTKKTI